MNKVWMHAYMYMCICMKCMCRIKELLYIFILMCIVMLFQHLNNKNQWNYMVQRMITYKKKKAKTIYTKWIHTRFIL